MFPLDSGGDVSCNPQYLGVWDVGSLERRSSNHVDEVQGHGWKLSRIQGSGGKTEKE